MSVQAPRGRRRSRASGRRTASSAAKAAPASSKNCESKMHDCDRPARRALRVSGLGGSREYFGPAGAEMRKKAPGLLRLAARLDIAGFSRPRRKQIEASQPAPHVTGAQRACGCEGVGRPPPSLRNGQKTEENIRKERCCLSHLLLPQQRKNAVRVIRTAVRALREPSACAVG